MACEHDLAVRQDPTSGDHELLFCTKCEMKPKRRVSAAASIKQAADGLLVSAEQRLNALDEAFRRIDAAQTDTIERLKKLEAWAHRPGVLDGLP